jgi:triosephosphate isomerase
MPVWAITQERLLSEQAQKCMSLLEKVVLKALGEEIAENVSILTVVVLKKTKEIFSKPDVDGGLMEELF